MILLQGRRSRTQDRDDIYCKNVGEITGYEAVIEPYSDDGICLRIWADGIAYYSSCRVMCTRYYGFWGLYCTREANPNNENFENLLEQYRNLSGYSRDYMDLYTIDPRIVRAGIVVFYEAMKDLKTRDLKRTNDVLSKETSVTIEEAYQWLEDNRFPVLHKYAPFIPDTEDKKLEKYRSDPRKLIRR